MANKVARKGRLTLEEIEVINKRLACGTPIANIAIEFDRSEKMIEKVKDGTYGKHSKEDDEQPLVVNITNEIKDMQTRLLEFAHKIVDEFNLQKKSLEFEIGALQEKINILNKNPDFIRAKEIIRTLEVGISARPN